MQMSILYFLMYVLVFTYWILEIFTQKLVKVKKNWPWLKKTDHCWKKCNKMSSNDFLNRFCCEGCLSRRNLVLNIVSNPTRCTSRDHLRIRLPLLSNPPFAQELKSAITYLNSMTTDPNTKCCTIINYSILTIWNQKQ